MGVITRQLHQQRAHGLGQLMSVHGVICHAYFTHAVEFGGRVSGGLDALTGDQHINIATDGLGRCDDVSGRAR